MKASPKQAAPSKRFTRFRRAWRAVGIWAGRSETAKTAKTIGELVGKTAIFFTIISYLVEAPDRSKQRHYQAWQILNTAHGQSGDGGRRAALLDLVNDGVELSNLDLSHANLSPDSLSLDLYNPILFSVVFRDVKLDHVRFLCGLPILRRIANEIPFLWTDDDGCPKLSNTKFFNASLSGTYFERPQLYAAEFTAMADAGEIMRDFGAKVVGGFFRANFHNINFKGASFSGSDMLGSAFVHVRMTSTTFKNSNLTNAKFEDVQIDLEDASIPATNRPAAINSMLESMFSGAVLSGTTFKNVTSEGAPLNTMWQRPLCAPKDSPDTFSPC